MAPRTGTESTVIFKIKGITAIILFDFAVSVVITCGLILIFHWAVRTRTVWPAHYRIFLLVFFASWAVVIWLRPYRPSNGLLISAVLFAAVALAISFLPARPPRNRPETKSLLDRVDKERSLERFFHSDFGKVFWPVLAILIFSITFRLATIF